MTEPRTLDELTQLATKFAEERDWGQFHNPKDVALSLVLEAAELAELTQWKNGDELRAHLDASSERLGEELADVLWWTLLFAHYQDIDLADAFVRSLPRTPRSTRSRRRAARPPSTRRSPVRTGSGAKARPSARSAGLVGSPAGRGRSCS